MDLKLYWGEIHTHTYCGSSRFGSLEDAAAIAQKHLDFWAPGEHTGSDGPGTPPAENFQKTWPEMRRIVDDITVPGKFVAFPGCESGFRHLGYGDYNMYFPDTSVAEMLITRDFEEYVAFAKAKGAMLIPHHSAYKAAVRSSGVNWDVFDPEVMPLIEIYSMHGSSESDDGPFPMDLNWMSPRCTASTVQRALRRGIKVGFIASSDGHNGYPGCYRMGLVAAYAKELTREALWDAFWKRRTYAVSGDRIKLGFEIDEHMMGEAFTGTAKRQIRACVEAEDVIDKLEILKNGRVIHRETNVMSAPLFDGRIKIRVEWGWGSGESDWCGRLGLSDGRIVAAAPNFGSPGMSEILTRNSDTCTWSSHTGPAKAVQNNWQHCRNGREPTNQIVFDLETEAGATVDLDLNGYGGTFSVERLLKDSHIVVCREGDEPSNSKQKIKIHRAVCMNRFTADCRLTDEKEHDCDYYYARVTQNNGQMAWSSPIWVS
jgi:uncharacterized protein DUF3604